MITRIAEAHAILDEALAAERVRGSILLYSGGNDSTVLLTLLGSRCDWIGHCNTGTGIPETRQFLGERVQALGLNGKLIEEFPINGVDDYETMVLKVGFPGPAKHRLAYQRLKERSLRRMKKKVVKEPRKDRVVFVSGVRAAESKIRVGYKRTTKLQGNEVWVNPLYYWTDEDMDQYRTLQSIPPNPVSEVLHISGECLCGAFAHPGEFEEIKFFFPEVAARIAALEEKARTQGIRACKWGVRPPGTKKSKPPGPLCAGCH